MTAREILKQKLEKYEVEHKMDVYIDDNINAFAAIYDAMEEYSEQNSDAEFELFNKPRQKLKPLEDLYRKENPRQDGKFYLPDTTSFYEWIVKKILA